MRLEHVVSYAATGQRDKQMPLRDAACLIKDARVSVDGACVLAPGYQVLVGSQEVTLDGTLLDCGLIFHSLLLFHKPIGSVCTAQSDKRSIFHCLTAAQQHPTLTFFGRLDRDTSGLMLLGTDGGIGHLLTSPDNHVGKEYWAYLLQGSRMRDWPLLPTHSCWFEWGFAPCCGKAADGYSTSPLRCRRSGGSRLGDGRRHHMSPCDDESRGRHAWRRVGRGGTCGNDAASRGGPAPDSGAQGSASCGR